MPKRDINPPVSRTCVSACTRIDALTYARIQNARWNAATLVPFRRIGLNGHDVAPSRIQPTSKHALKYLFSTGCRPSLRVESSRGTFPRKFSLIKPLTRFHYVLLFIFSLFFPSFYSLCVYEILKIIINPISKILLRFLYASNGALNSLDLFSSLRVATFIVM